MTLRKEQNAGSPETVDDVDANNEQYQPLYDGCPITEDQSILLVSLYATRHRLSHV